MANGRGNFLRWAVMGVMGIAVGSCGLGDVNKTIEENKQAVSGSTEAIAANRSAVGQATDAINGIKDAVNKTTEAIRANEEAVKNASGAIAENAKELQATSDAVKQSTVAVGENVKAVEATSAAIQKNADAISASSAAIAANTKIADESSEAIKKNLESVAGSTAEVAKNAEQIGTSTEAIRGNAEAISKSTLVIDANGKAIRESTEAIEKNREMVAGAHREAGGSHFAARGEVDCWAGGGGDCGGVCDDDWDVSDAGGNTEVDGADGAGIGGDEERNGLKLGLRPMYRRDADATMEDCMRLRMRMVLLVGCSALLQACGTDIWENSGHPLAQASDVKIYTERPGKYERLGTVTHLGGLDPDWQSRADGTAVFNDLLSEAAAMGANGLLLRDDTTAADAAATMNYKGQSYSLPYEKKSSTVLVQGIFVLKE